MRELGLMRQSKKAMQYASQELKSCLNAFNTGVNEYVRSLKVLPMEFLITGMKWEDWKVEDIYLMQKIVSFQMIYDYVFELMHTKLRDIYGEEFVREILGRGS